MMVTLAMLALAGAVLLVLSYAAEGPGRRTLFTRPLHGLREFGRMSVVYGDSVQRGREYLAR
ncbi:hypothetical protein [Pseudonocardia sp.]|uniref:hypothetical protein n=1 Tax=Pseudonocardia sp. TaxID=60912 RepID=UPI002604EE41|nr:hypothetical protein [Pseudonocardia sp.]